MKIAICTAAVLAACASPMVAQAQSSVTLYGIIDNGIAYSELSRLFDQHERRIALVDANRLG